MNFDVEFWFEIFHKLVDKLLDVVFPHIDRLDQFPQSLVVHDGVVLDFDDEFVGGSEERLEEKDLMTEMDVIEGASDKNDTVLFELLDLVFGGCGLEVSFDERTLGEKL
jgi:hypothetical protein